MQPMQRKEVLAAHRVDKKRLTAMHEHEQNISYSILQAWDSDLLTINPGPAQ
jgi:hypothetical protein